MVAININVQVEISKVFFLTEIFKYGINLISPAKEIEKQNTELVMILNSLKNKLPKTKRTIPNPRIGSSTRQFILEK